MKLSSAAKKSILFDLILPAILAGSLQAVLYPWAQSLTTYEGVGWIVLALAVMSMEVGPVWTFIGLWLMMFAITCVVSAIAWSTRWIVTAFRQRFFQPKVSASS